MLFRHAEFLTKSEPKEPVTQETEPETKKARESPPESNVWTEPSTSSQLEQSKERSQEDEFDEYLRNMFM